MSRIEGALFQGVVAGVVGVLYGAIQGETSRQMAVRVVFCFLAGFAWRLVHPFDSKVKP